MTSPSLNLASMDIPANIIANYQFDIEDYLLPDREAILELSPYDDEDDVGEDLPAYRDAMIHTHDPAFIEIYNA